MLRVKSVYAPATGRIGAVILAAGASRRMGSAKALLPLGERSFVARLVDSIKGSGVVESIVVVTGLESQQVREALAGHDASLSFAHNERYDDGEMLASVQAGVKRMAQTGCEAFFIALVDQPMILPETFSMLASAWSDAHPTLVRPRYQGRHGHPILISIVAAGEILSLAAGDTLKTFVTNHADESLEIDVDDPAVISDIDTPQQYQAALAEWIASHREDQRATEGLCPSPASKTPPPAAWASI